MTPSLEKIEAKWTLPSGRSSRARASGRARVSAPTPALSLALTPDGSLEIQVGPETLGRPEARARLLRPDGSVHFASVFSSDGVMELQRSAHRLENLAPGSYRLVVEGAGSHEVLVHEGATSVVRLP